MTDTLGIGVLPALRTTPEILPPVVSAALMLVTGACATWTSCASAASRTLS